MNWPSEFRFPSGDKNRAPVMAGNAFEIKENLFEKDAFCGWLLKYGPLFTPMVPFGHGLSAPAEPSVTIFPGLPHDGEGRA